MPGLTHWSHPGFFGYFTAANTFEGILGDLYASSVINPGFNWVCSPACTELEAVVMDWAAKMLGLDEKLLNTSLTGGGVIQTSASDSTLVVTVAARALYQRMHPDINLNDLVVYTSTQTHSNGAKAALVLGFQHRALEAKIEDNYALRGETLRLAMEEDRKAGKHPFILIASLGTTSTGAIDRMDEIAAVAEQYPDLWLHVDAAWAGMALVCPEYRESSHLSIINKHFRSFCVNFHKWGLVNFDCSCLWVKDRNNLTDALDITPPFLRTKEADAGTVIDYRNWHLSFGRRFRSLKLWFVLRGFGVEGFQAHIRKGIAVSDHFASLIRTSEYFELVTPPSFALSVFRMKDIKSANLSSDILTRTLHDRIYSRKDIFLTQTVLDGVFCIRMAVGASRTEKAHVDTAYHILCEEARTTITQLQT